MQYGFPAHYQMDLPESDEVPVRLTFLWIVDERPDIFVSSDRQFPRFLTSFTPPAAVRPAYSYNTRNYSFVYEAKLKTQPKQRRLRFALSCRRPARHGAGQGVIYRGLSAPILAGVTLSGA